jgi:hypothetical protein
MLCSSWNLIRILHNWALVTITHILAIMCGIVAYLFYVISLLRPLSHSMCKQQKGNGHGSSNNPMGSSENRIPVYPLAHQSLSVCRYAPVSDTPNWATILLGGKTNIATVESSFTHFVSLCSTPRNMFLVLTSCSNAVCGWLPRHLLGTNSSRRGGFGRAVVRMACVQCGFDWRFSMLYLGFQRWYNAMHLL